MNPFTNNNDIEINNSKVTSSNDEISHINNFESDKKFIDMLLYNNNFNLIKKPQNLGGTRNCFYIKNYPYISIGKNISLPLLLILFICLTYLYIFYFFFEDCGFALQKSFNYCFLIYILSHSIAIFLNPGIPSFEYNKQIKKDLVSKNINELDCTRCKICNLNYKLIDKIGHCEKCEICYFGYDHHCIWTGHCVTKTNGLFFIIFLMSIFIFILICFTMIFIKIIKIFLL